MACAGARRAGVRFVYDDSFRAATREFVAAVIAFYVVQRHNGEEMRLEQGCALGKTAFEPARGAGSDSFGRKVKALAHLGDPLLHKVRRAEDGEASNLTAIVQLARNQERFNGLAESDVIGDEEAHG